LHSYCSNTCYDDACYGWVRSNTCEYTVNWQLLACRYGSLDKLLLKSFCQNIIVSQPYVYFKKLALRCRTQQPDAQVVRQAQQIQTATVPPARFYNMLNRKATVNSYVITLQAA
jgi:hypothetical protein